MKMLIFKCLGAKALVIAVLLITFTSCNSSKKEIDSQFILNLADSDFEIPSPYGFYILFVTLEKNEKLVTNVDALHDTFIKYYSKSYVNFESFLNEALNQNLIFAKAEFYQQTSTSFKINEKILANYVSLGILSFVNHYCEESEGRMIVKSEFVNEDLYSILYYCYINNYQISFDDYRGKVHVEKGKW